MHKYLQLQIGLRRDGTNLFKRQLTRQHRAGKSQPLCLLHP